MDRIQFWDIIEQSASFPDQVSALQDLLVSFSLSDIVDFEIILRELIRELDDFKVMGILKIIDGYVTDDPYLYFRCWIIGKGKKVFDMALQNPDDLADIVNSATVADFEDLLYMADDAYEEKGGSESETPREIAYGKGLDYDAETKGGEWEENDLPGLYPRLWVIFN